MKGLDVVFPVLHGMYGEDGTIQGLFEILKIPYGGCGVLSSSIAMDKIYTKIIFDKIGINQAKYMDIRKYNDKYIYVDENFNLYYPEDIDGNGLFDDIAYSDVGAHALSVVDITDSNQLIVSSWGKEYIIDISDIVQASVTTIEYNDFSSDYESFVK